MQNRKIRIPPPVSVTIAAIAWLLLFPIFPMAMAQEPGSEAPTIAVDFTGATVDGINMRDGIDKIKEQIGAEHVTEEVVVFEGRTSLSNEIDIDGHVIDYDRSSVSFTDPVFRTREGLGVGSRVKEFDRHYGVGSLVRGGGGAVSIYYSSKRPPYRFSVSVEDSKKPFVEKSFFDDFPAERITIWLDN